MTLAARLEQIIREQGLTRADFARRMGITQNYLYILTGSKAHKNKAPVGISRSLVKLIALEFGYNEEWIASGAGEPRKKDENAAG